MVVRCCPECVCRGVSERGMSKGGRACECAGFVACVNCSKQCRCRVVAGGGVGGRVGAEVELAGGAEGLVRGDTQGSSCVRGRVSITRVAFV